MAHNMMKSAMQRDVSEKSFNWLILLSSNFATMQVQFLQAAMDNLNTMHENTSFSYKSQETLDAMSKEDRDCYIQLRDGRRKKFITAQAHFRTNLIMFRQATQMVNTIFSLFGKSCRFRAS
jgi:hypothetical protein